MPTSDIAAWSRFSMSRWRERTFASRALKIYCSGLFYIISVEIDLMRDRERRRCSIPLLVCVVAKLCSLCKGPLLCSLVGVYCMLHRVFIPTYRLLFILRWEVDIGVHFSRLVWLMDGP